MATVATINELGGHAHNPRGNLWFNDESSYGKKLLAKMGWSKGKGLGKNEDGIKENLKVKFKNTNSGLGFKDDPYANVMKTEYESILKNLRDEYPQQKTVNGCSKDVAYENKYFRQNSKIVKRKIRYPKLYRAKDVSKYSEKDMKSIFICSLPFKDNEEEESKDSGFCFKKEHENQKPKVHEICTSHLSISDYFNLKMKGKKDSELEKKLSKMKQEETESCCDNVYCDIKKAKSYLESGVIDYKMKEEKSNFECKKTNCKIDGEQTDFQSCITEDSMTKLSRKKCKKKRRNSEMDINGSDKDLFFVGKKSNDEITSNKKRKKLDEPSEYDETVSAERMWEKLNDQLSPSKKKRKKLHKKENLSTSADTVKFSLGQLSIDTDIVPDKKKKKSHKKKEDTFVSVELLSMPSPKDELLANRELLNNLSPSGSMEITDESLSNINNNKRTKKLKNKLNSFNKLKSCLKGKSSKYAVKNVSFNEHVSYKIIESDNESIDSPSDCQDKVQNGFKISVPDNNPELKKDSGDNETEVQDTSLSEQNGDNFSNALATASKEEMQTCDSLSSLPSSNSSLYNSWVESQQLALKMKIYKDLLKSIKKHDILKTTNLLHIKGYGNWGF